MQDPPPEHTHTHPLTAPSAPYTLSPTHTHTHLTPQLKLISSLLECFSRQFESCYCDTRWQDNKIPLPLVNGQCEACLQRGPWGLREVGRTVSGRALRASPHHSHLPVAELRRGGCEEKRSLLFDSSSFIIYAQGGEPDICVAGSTFLSSEWLSPHAEE